MSNVLIISTRWIYENDAYPQNIIFKDKLVRNNHPHSDIVYKQAIVQNYLLNDKSNVIAEMFGVEENENGIKVLLSAAQKLLDSDFGDAELLREDIESADWGNLLQDIYDALRINCHDTKLIHLISSFIPPNKLNFPCYYKSMDGYLAIGISPLPYKTAGDQFCDAWCKALLDDFSQEKDNVILALHGSTDWNHPEKNGYGPMVEYSKALSSEMGRDVHVYVYIHVDFDPIAKAIKMGDSSLSEIWTHIINHGKE